MALDKSHFHCSYLLHVDSAGGGGGGEEGGYNSQ